jgi:predicted DNA-binding mobile mystery protein A
VRAIRDALGMSAADLAGRLGISQQAVSQLERSEQDGSARIDTLRRAAEALDCTFVYAFVPNDTLEGTVDSRARSLARAEVAATNQTMLLEDQELESVNDTLLEQLADELKLSSRLWRD